jgi:uncharacterized repeat protein (TIGR01451 family)
MAVQHLLRSRPTQAFTRLFAVLAFLLVAIAGAAPRSAQAAVPTALALEFNGTDDAATLNTFLNTSLLGTKAPNTDAQANTVVPGALQIVSSDGDLPPFSTTPQDNALSVAPFDSSGFYMIGARLLNPVFNTHYQSAGIYVGKANNQYIRFTAGRGSKNSTGDRLELDVLESNGKLRSSIIPLPLGTLTGINTLDLFLKIEHGGSGRITALYRINSDDPNAGRLATSRNFPRWLRQGSPTVFAGVITTNRGTLEKITMLYDWFRFTTDPNQPQVVASVSGTKTVDNDGVPPGPAVNPGDTLTYTINVTNNGTAPTNVQLVDPIPGDTAYVNGSVNTLVFGVPLVPGATFEGANNRIVLPNTSLAAGAQLVITYQVKINAAPLHSSTIVNTAELTYGTSTTPALLSASTTVGATPDLSDSTYVASPAAVSPNGTVTYTLNLLNSGTAAASGATAQFSIPSGTTLVPNSATASSGSLSIDPSLTTLSWSAAGPLAADQTGTATISFAVNVGSGFTNGAALFSRAILQANGTLPTIVTAQAIYSVATAVGGIKTVDKAQATPGAPLSYLITVTNTSGALVRDVQVVDPIPQDTTFNGNLSATAGTAIYEAGNNRVVWSLPPLANGQSINMSFQVLINQLPLHSAVIANKAVLTVPGQADSLLSTSTIVDGVADLSHSLYTADPTSVAPNGTITYLLNLLNDGTAAATNATAELTIPAGVTLVANSATATSGNLNVNTGLSKITWTASGPLPIGSVTRISFQAKLDSTTANTIFTSTATMQATGTVPYIASAQSNLVGPAPTGTKIYMPIIVR